MCDGATTKDGNLTEEFHYRKGNSPIEMDGCHFVCTQEIPWVPWLYIYKLSFLNEHHLRFVENVRFEDTDFVLKCTIKAKSIQYQPILLVNHLIHDEQGSYIGDNTEKINDLFFISYRCRLLAEEEQKAHKEASNAVMGHHLFSYNANLVRYFWRLPYSKMLEILKKYPPYYSVNAYLLVRLSAKYPTAFSMLAITMKPFLYLAYRVKKMLEKT